MQSSCYFEKFDYMSSPLPNYVGKEKSLRFNERTELKNLLENSEESELDKSILKFSPLLKYNRLPKTVSIGDNIFTLPYELEHIARSIEKSQWLLNLKDNWNDEGGIATNKETFLKAIKFIIEYSKYIFDELDRTIIDCPDIDILQDGSIIVNWETDGSSFSIIFDKRDTEFSYYYAKIKNGQLPPLKYAVKTNPGIDNLITAPWMAINLKLKKAIHSL